MHHYAWQVAGVHEGSSQLNYSKLRLGISLDVL